MLLSIVSAVHMDSTRLYHGWRETKGRESKVGFKVCCQK